MKVILVIALVWFLGSYLCYRIWGTDAVLPYIGVTVLLAVLAIVRANRKKA